MQKQELENKCKHCCVLVDMHEGTIRAQLGTKK